ncbi:MAG TPA: sugar dehydrogenase complex small subunit [bacterium]|jgi:hypothetical protein
MIPQRPTMTRRQLLAAGAAVAAAQVAAGCAPIRALLGRPVLSTSEFLALSAVLTGVSGLDPAVGTVYLDALKGVPDGIRLTELYDRAGFRSPVPPADATAMARTGVFADAGLRRLADAILNYWYTGMYRTAQGPRVATYAGALAWTTLRFTKSPTVCGGATGYWARPPQ